MDKKQENSQNNADAQESKPQFLKPRDPARSASSEGSGSSPNLLWSPLSRFGSFRLSSPESDDVFFAGCLTPLPRHVQHVSLKDEKRVETEPTISCQEIKIEDIEVENVEIMEEATLKRNEDEHTVIKERQFRGPKEDISEKKDCAINETEGEKTKKTTQMPVIIPPTSHLALRRKLKRHSSNPLLIRPREESVGSTHYATNEVLFPGSNIGANMDYIPPREDCFMHQTLMSQAFNPALTAGMPEKRVDSTRYHTHNVLLSTSVVRSTPAMIPLTSSLAMRRKLTRQASSPLPFRTCEESVDFSRDIAHNMVLSTPSIPLTPAVISATSNPAMSRTLKRQTSDAMPTGMDNESVYSAQVTTREVTRGVKHPLRLPPLSSSLNSVDIPPTSHLAQRRKLKRQASNSLPAGTSAESTQSPTHPVQVHVTPPAMQNINQPTRPPKTPRSATGHGKHFFHPEDSRVPTKSKRKTRTRRVSDSDKSCQKEKCALEKHSDPLQEGNSSNSFQLRMQLPHQRAKSLDRMSSSSRSSAQVRNGSAIVVPRRPTRLHTIKERLPPLQPSGGENPKRSFAVGRVLAAKAKDNRPLSLPAIPVSTTLTIHSLRPR